MQTGPGALASSTPSQGTTGAGGAHRRSPTGGAAYGMPWYCRRTDRAESLRSITPRTAPPVTATVSPIGCGSACDQHPRPATIKTSTGTRMARCATDGTLATHVSPRASASTSSVNVPPTSTDSPGCDWSAGLMGLDDLNLKPSRTAPSYARQCVTRHRAACAAFADAKC